jgi:hypothetical protein
MAITIPMHDLIHQLTDWMCWMHLHPLQLRCDAKLSLQVPCAVCLYTVWWVGGWCLYCTPYGVI